MVAVTSTAACSIVPVVAVAVGTRVGAIRARTTAAVYVVWPSLRHVGSRYVVAAVLAV